MYRKCNADIKDINDAIQHTFFTIFGTKGLQFATSASSVYRLPAMDMSLGSQIKYFRELKGITQEELGTAVGMTKYAIRNIENNEMRLVNLSLLDKLIDCLGIQDKIRYEDEYIRFIKNNPIALIKDYRKRNNLTQYQLSKLLNVGDGTVKQWETGRCVISRNSYEKIKKLFTEDFLSDE